MGVSELEAEVTLAAAASLDLIPLAAVKRQPLPGGHLAPPASGPQAADMRCRCEGFE